MSVRSVLDDIQAVVDKGEGKPNDLIQKARSLLEKSGDDATALIAQLMGENYDMRVERRDLKAKLPKEGMVVLSAEESKTWEALKGFDPKDVTAKLAERDKFEGDLKKSARQTAIATAAKAAKMNPAVLGRLAGEDLVFEVTGEGDKAVATVKDAKGVSTPLLDYAKANWSEFAPSLAADPKTQGVDWVNQGGGGSGSAAPNDAVTKRLEANKGRHQSGNALRPAPTT